MQNLPAMHESNAFTDLPHKHYAGLFRQDKIVVDYTLKELPAWNSVKEKKFLMVLLQKCMHTFCNVILFVSSLQLPVTFTIL